MNIQKEIAEKYQPLFEHMMDEHGLILLCSQMDEIIILAQKVIDNFKPTDITNNTFFCFDEDALGKKARCKYMCAICKNNGTNL